MPKKISSSKSRATASKKPAPKKAAATITANKNRRPKVNKAKPVNNKVNKTNETTSSFNPKALALSIGTLWGLIIFVITLASHFNGYGEEFLLSITSIYVGYDISVAGAVIGFLYGFLEGVIGTYLIVSLYRFFSCKSKK